MTKYISNAFSLSMLPSNAIVTVTSPSEGEVREFLQGEVISAVGHSATTEIIRELTGISVPVNRAPITLKEGDEVLVLQLLKRLEEGKVLTSEEMRQFPIAWRKVKVSLTF
jgi:hypothetical protein